MSYAVYYHYRSSADSAISMPMSRMYDDDDDDVTWARHDNAIGSGGGGGYVGGGGLKTLFPIYMSPLRGTS